MMKKTVNVRVKKKERRQIKIDGEFIKLDALLKLSDLVMTGGHAKIVIQDGDVRVNSEICTARGKKIRKGDCVEFGGVIIEVV